jgi:DNA-nicking Smr family endonuclease
MAPERDERDPEDDLFAEEMADVRRLEQDRHLPELCLRTPVPLSKREREVLRELDRLVAGEGPFDLRDSDEYIEGKVAGLDPRVVKRLRRGEFTVQADLDLHGQDAASARVAVERYIQECHSRGLRCVRIVHGRGRNSPGGVPVLKDSLPRWLSRGPARLIVLAYTTAARKDGGAGATYVLLRKPRGRPPRSEPL